MSTPVKRSPQKLARCKWVPARVLEGARWDPAFWHSGGEELAVACKFPLAPLGQFIEHLTYGAILPGRPPVPAAEGVAIIGQRALRPTGLLLDRAIVVGEGSPHDLPRCRLKVGDIVLARSGVGALRRKLFTVFRAPVTATVSCFVDLVRLKGISPYYVVAFLRSDLGWPQVERLIAGVGTPNLSFAQIRSLQIPLLPPEGQQRVEAEWLEVARLHDSGRLAEAEARLDAIVRRLEQRLVAEGA